MTAALGVVNPNAFGVGLGGPVKRKRAAAKKKAEAKRVEKAATAAAATSARVEAQAATAGADVNPYAIARATVTTAASAFESTRQIAVAELAPAGFQLYEQAKGYWKIIQYPQSVYPCNTDSMKKISFRGDFWIAAQQNLARLVAASMSPPFTSPLPEIGTKEREYVAALFADWYMAVLSWVSLAAYSTNIQPAFLCPDSPFALANPKGLQLPTRTAGDGLPGDLETLRRELQAGHAKFYAQVPGKGNWGPMWAEYGSKGEAVAWLKGDFRPSRDPQATRIRNGNGGVTQIRPNDKARRKFYSTVQNWKTVRTNFDDPWYQAYFAVLYGDFGEPMLEWQALDTTGRNDWSGNHYMYGPASLLRIGQAWAKWVYSQTIMDVIITSSSWYATNYMEFWNAQGLLSYPPSQVASALTNVKRGQQAVKQQTAQRTVGAITSTGVTIAAAVATVPVAGTIAAGCALVITGIAALICRRRRKKKLTVPLMQPLMLRSLSDPNCDYFKPTDTLDQSLAAFLTQLKAQSAALDSAPGTAVPSLGADDPLGTLVPTIATQSSAATQAAVASQPTSAVPAPGAEASTTATATLPATTAPQYAAPQVDASAPSNTSVGFAESEPISSSVEPDPAVPPIPTVQQIEAAAVVARTESPAVAGTANPMSAGASPWMWVGIGASAVAVVALLRK